MSRITPHEERGSAFFPDGREGKRERDRNIDKTFWRRREPVGHALEMEHRSFERGQLFVDPGIIEVAQQALVEDLAGHTIHVGMVPGKDNLERGEVPFFPENRHSPARLGFYISKKRIKLV